MTIRSVILKAIFFAAIIFAMQSAKAAPVVVAVIDTGMDANSTVPLCKNGYLDFAQTGANQDQSPLKHGTNVAGLITKNAGKGDYCLVIINVYKGTKLDLLAYYAALQYLIKLKPAILNLSLSGFGELTPEKERIKQLLDAGTVIVAASGNDNTELTMSNCTIFPACADRRIFVIGATDLPSSNKGEVVDTTGPAEGTALGITLTGSSQAAAAFTGQAINLALKRKK